MKAKHTFVLYMAGREELTVTIESMADEGKVVTAVSPLKPFIDSTMGGYFVTDWIIVYYSDGEAK